MEIEPYYLAIGMSHEQFWYGDPWLCVVFRDMHNLKREMRNEELWLQGLYNFNALSTVLSNFGQMFTKHKRAPQKYIQQPIRVTPLSEAEKRQKEIAERKKVIAYFTNLQKQWERREKNGS